VKPLMRRMHQYVANRNVFRDCLKGTLYLRAADHYTAIRWLVHWSLMGGLLQQGGAWAGWSLVWVRI